MRQSLCALSACALLAVAAALDASAQGEWMIDDAAPLVEGTPRSFLAARPAFAAETQFAATDPSQSMLVPVAANEVPAQFVQDGEVWIAPPGQGPPIDTLPLGDDGVHWIEPPGESPVVYDSYPGVYPTQPWVWQVLPDGLIYRSYWAGVHEPRLAVTIFDEGGNTSYWDATLGGRVGLLRYGDTNALRPQGWELDFEGAAIMRFTLDYARDFETADYRAGVPLTYGIGDWQFKFGYYHLSSHMGDERAIREDLLDERINYVRDSLLLGASYYPHPYVRLYSEVGYAFKTDGGAEPWEFQFGTEIARPGPTGKHGTPFLALNGHLREEHDFGGDVTVQTGWLWRGCDGKVARVGFHYFNGKSSQYQTFDDSEEQVGFGVWYDY